MSRARSSAPAHNEKPAHSTRFSALSPAVPPDTALLYSPGKRQRYDDSDDDSEGDDGDSSSGRSSGSSGSRRRSGRSGGGSSNESGSSGDERGARRRRRRRRGGRSSSSTLVIVVLAVLLAVAIGLAVYFYMTKSSTSSEASSTTDAPVTSATDRTAASFGVGHTASASSATPSGVSSKSSGGSSGGGGNGQNSATKTADASAASSSEDETATANATQTAAASTSTGSMSSFAQSCLDEHNSARSTHHAPDLVWNETLADAAAKWAANCKFEHSGGSLLPSSYGENIYMVSPVQQSDTMEPAAGVKSWNDEESTYNFDSPGASTGDTGHFTQDVWVGTTDVGCAMQPCMGIMSSGEYGAYLVCDYSPPGNVMFDDGSGDSYSLYKKNVLAP